MEWESLYNGLDSTGIDFKSETADSGLFSDEKGNSKTYQVHKKYIVSSIKSGIVYINQQLAHQRILYEEFLENITVRDAMSQQLLFPLELSFNKVDINLIKEIKDDLESIGFLFEEILNDLKSIDYNIKQVETDLEKSGAPYTPGRIPEWKNN